MKLVVGARGRLGSAICAALPAGDIIALARPRYQNWWQVDAAAEIGAFLDRQESPIDCIFIAAGVIDPAAPAVEHERANLHLPRLLLRAAASRGIRVVTFGTMMEVMSQGMPASAYVASKLALAEEVRSSCSNALHLRINTLYGGPPPAPHMFSGQMIDSIRRRSPFRMSPGTQLREYHHVDDEARAIISLASSKHCGVLDLNHGAPVTLASLAHRTFEALDALDLLQIGALPAPANERLDLPYLRSPMLGECGFRDVLSAMPVYVRDCLAASRSEA